MPLNALPISIPWILLLNSGLFIIATGNPNPGNFATAENVSSASTVFRVFLHFLLVTMIGSVSYGMFWLMRQESRRQQRMKTFMQDANAQLGRSQVPQSLIQAHMRLRKEIFAKHTAESIEYASVEEADEVVESNNDYAGSWQRSLPTDVKQELKAAVLRRTVATIRQYEAIKREFDAKAMLFERRLIADVHWQSVKAEYEDICAQLKLIIHDANCLEDDWGSRPDGLFHTAAMIDRHEALKEREEEEKRQAAKEAEKEKQRQEKQKGLAEKEERERQARQERRAADALKALLEEEGVNEEILSKRRNSKGKRAAR